jgi:hypothetical protein
MTVAVRRDLLCERPRTPTEGANETPPSPKRKEGFKHRRKELNKTRQYKKAIE